MTDAGRKDAAIEKDATRPVGSLKTRLQRWFDSLRWTDVIIPIAGAIVISIAILIWKKFPAGGTLGQPTSDDLLEQMMDRAIGNAVFEFSLWSRANIIIQMVLIMGALLATVFASLTTNSNADRIKKWSVFLTALTAAFASLQSVFHVRENIETFIQSDSKLETLEVQYVSDREALREKSTLKNDKGEKVLNKADLYLLYRNYAPKMSEVTAAESRAWANVGQQSLIQNIGEPPSPPISTSAPPP